MTGTLLSTPVFRAVDANGLPMPGAQLQFYLTGTTTPAAVYSSAALSVPLANPVVADSGGLFAPIFLDPTVTYRARLYNGAGVLYADMDPINGPVSIGAGAVGAAQLAAGVAIANLGFTPINRAGDTATNLQIVNTASNALSAGYLGAPLNEQDVNYTFQLIDAGKMVRAAVVSGVTWTIPPNSAVAFPLGTTIVLRNWALSSVVTLARGTGVFLYLAGGTVNKDVSLAGGAMATLIQENPNEWVVSGVGIS